MSKAEEAALKAYPKETRDITGFVVDIGHPQHMRDLYIEGYHQAEKDLELTWEDIKEICVQSVLVEVDLGGLVSDERHYTEVLKRFKAQKGEEV